MSKRICTGCGVYTDRDKLLVKKVVFLTMGSGGRTIRSRAKGWLCPECRAKDADWIQKAFSNPGPEFQSTGAVRAS